jgi:hypothetical protein
MIVYAQATQKLLELPKSPDYPNLRRLKKQRNQDTFLLEELLLRFPYEVVYKIHYLPKAFYNKNM